MALQDEVTALQDEMAVLHHLLVQEGVFRGQVIGELAAAREILGEFEEELQASGSS